LVKNVEQVFGGPVLHADFEHHRSEEVATGLLYIDLDAANDADLDVWDGLDDPLNVALRDAVHSEGQLGHGLLSLLYLSEIGLQRFSDVHKLVVECVGPCWHQHSRLLVRLRVPLVLLEPLEGIDGGTARVVIE